MNPLSLLVALLLAAPAGADDSAAPAVLVIGDSHTAGTFGRTLDADLRAPKTGHIATFGVCSARTESFVSRWEHACGWYFKDFDDKTPQDLLETRPGEITVVKNGEKVKRKVTYVKTPSLGALLARYNPKAVIVALGSNGLAAASLQETLKLIHAGKGDNNDRACFWVGPPKMRNTSADQLKAWYALLAANKVSETSNPLGDSCKLILDSRKVPGLDYPAQGGDGTHYEADGLASKAVAWGHAASKAFSAALQP